MVTQLSAIHRAVLVLAFENRTREHAESWQRVLAYATPSRRFLIADLPPDSWIQVDPARPAEARLVGWDFANADLAQSWADALGAKDDKPATIADARRADPDVYGYELLTRVYGLPMPAQWPCRLTRRRRLAPGNVWRWQLARGAVDRQAYNAARASCSRSMARLVARGLVAPHWHLGHAGWSLTAAGWEAMVSRSEKLHNRLTIARPDPVQAGQRVGALRGLIGAVPT